MEDGLVKLLGEKRNSSDGSESEGDFDSLNRRIYGKAEGDGEILSPVLYRDTLAKTFDSQGFANFRNLAKLSRPKKKKRRNLKGRGGEAQQGCCFWMSGMRIKAWKSCPRQLRQC